MSSVVFVVDHDVSVRESLQLLIRSAGWEPQLFASADEFINRVRAPAPSSCLVLDVCLSDLSGLELQERLATEQMAMPIIFITGHGDVPTTVRAMKAGAVDFLTKPCGDDVLLTAIRHALERSRVGLGLEAELRELRSYYAALSRREREVMALVVSGLLNKQVGSTLGISEITVKAHRGMRKMMANSLPDLVTMAVTLEFGAGPRSPGRRWERGHEPRPQYHRDGRRHDGAALSAPSWSAHLGDLRSFSTAWTSAAR